MNTKNYAKSTVLELKIELGKRKLSDKGNKIQLIQRLEQDDKQKKQETTVAKKVQDYDKFTISQLKVELKKRNLSDFGNKIMMIRKLQEDDKKTPEQTKADKDNKPESKNGSISVQATVKTESIKKGVVTDEVKEAKKNLGLKKEVVTDEVKEAEKNRDIKKEVITDEVKEAEKNLGKAEFGEKILLAGNFNVGYNIMHSLKMVVIKNVPTQQADKPFLFRWLKKAKNSRTEIKEKGRCNIVLKFSNVTLGNQAYISIKKGIDDGIVQVCHPNFEYIGAHPCEYWRQITSLCEPSDAPLSKFDLDDRNRNKNDDHKRHCVIENLPVDVTEEDLMGTFKEATHIHVFSYDPTSAGIALLEFENSEKANNFAAKNKTVTFKKKSYPLSLYIEKLPQWHKIADKAFAKLNKRTILKNPIRIGFLKIHNEIHEEKRQLLDKEDMTAVEKLTQFAKLNERDRVIKAALNEDHRARNFKKIPFPEPENLVLHKTYPPSPFAKTKQDKQKENPSSDTTLKKGTVTKPSEKNIPVKKPFQQAQQNKPQKSSVPSLMNTTNKRAGSSTNFGPAQKFQKFNDKKVMGVYDSKPVASGVSSMAKGFTHTSGSKSLLGEPPTSLLGQPPRIQQSTLSQPGLLQYKPPMSALYQPQSHESRNVLRLEEDRFSRIDSRLGRSGVPAGVDNRFSGTDSLMIPGQDSRFSRSGTDTSINSGSKDNRFGRSSTDIFVNYGENDRFSRIDALIKSGEDNRFSRSGTDISMKTGEDSRFSRSGTDMALKTREDSRFGRSGIDMFTKSGEDNRFPRSGLDLAMKTGEDHRFPRSGLDLAMRTGEDHRFPRSGLDLAMKTGDDSRFSRTNTDIFRSTGAGGLPHDVPETQLSWKNGSHETADPFRSVTGRFTDTQRRLSSGAFVDDFNKPVSREINSGPSRSTAEMMLARDAFYRNQDYEGESLNRTPAQQLTRSGFQDQNMLPSTVQKMKSTIGEQYKHLISTNLDPELNKPGYGTDIFDKRSLSASGRYEGRTQDPVWPVSRETLGDGAGITGRPPREAWKTSSSQPQSLMSLGREQQYPTTQSWTGLSSKSSFGTTPVSLGSATLQQKSHAELMNYNHSNATAERSIKNPEYHFQRSMASEQSASFYDSASLRPGLVSAAGNRWPSQDPERDYSSSKAAFTSLQRSNFNKELDAFKRNVGSSGDAFQSVDLDYDTRGGAVRSLMSSRGTGMDSRMSAPARRMDTNFEMKHAAFRAGRL